MILNSNNPNHQENYNKLLRVARNLLGVYLEEIKGLVNMEK
jgi:hypothetical protein